MQNKSEKKAVRRSFYFSPKNLDLLDFLDSRKDISPNEFLIEILRSAQNNTHPHSNQNQDMSNEELYGKIEALISNLKVVQSSELEIIETTTTIKQEDNSIPVFDKETLASMDDCL